MDDVTYHVVVNVRDPDNIEIFPDSPIHCKIFKQLLMMFVLHMYKHTDMRKTEGQSDGQTY